jgi:SAM-dependent methyltransferase
MRVDDLDRDMADVIPTGVSVDSAFLFERMERATLDALGSGAGARVLDLAAGVGQDDHALAARGAFAVGAEPSSRMMGLARLRDAQVGAPTPGRVARVRAWGDALPFRDGAFDACFCKGSLDHFDDPLAVLREMARVTRPGGAVVLAVANFEALGCRLLRLEERLPGRAARPGRRHFDVPSDHFTRYDPALVAAQLGSVAPIESTHGVSLLWGWRPWARLLGRLPVRIARGLLEAADALARRTPTLADVIVIVARAGGAGSAGAQRATSSRYTASVRAAIEGQA